LSEKGLSPVVATVLIIAITVAAVALVGYWYPNIIKQQTEDTSEYIESSTNCLYASIDSHDATIYNSTKRLVFDVDNTGEKTLTITQNIILYTNGTKETHSENVTLSPADISRFNYSISSTDISRIRTLTNCEKIFDEISSSSISIL